MAGIRDAINAKTENTSVKANVITDASGSRLVLTSKETGASNTISITVNDNDGNNTDAYDALANTSPGLSQLAYTGGANNLSQIQAAQNAAIKLDNVSLSFSSNTITDAIAGTTLKLTKENAEYKCKQCFAKITLDRFPQPYMTVTQNEYDEKLYTEKLCKKCYTEQKLLEELEKSELKFTVDRSNFIKGWRARGEI